MEKTDQQLQQMLAGISIPPCPELLQEVMREVARPNVEIERIAQPLKKDAAMTAALLKLANSAQFRRGTKIASVSQAISTLGLSTTVNLLKNVALKQSMSGNHPKFEKFWERSSHCAAVAAKLAKSLACVSPDHAYLAALFHDCGIPVLMQNYPDYRQTIMKEGKMGQEIYAVEEAHYSTNHAVVGHMLARTWQLPQPVCQAILLHHDETIYASPLNHANRELRLLIDMIYMAEMIVDEHICQHNPEWERVQNVVLSDCEISESEFAELKDDMLGYLNDE